MVIILDYNNAQSDTINEVLLENNIEYKYSLSEKLITTADKIILPHPHYFNSAYKKMQLMNLFSFLRLIKKPILGINDGFCFMCNEIFDQYKCGLGFFQIDLKSISCATENVTEIDLVEGKLELKENCMLVDGKYSKAKVNFDFHSQLREYEYTSSLIHYNNDVYSLTYENENYFACELNFVKNIDLGKSIIKNFLNL